MKHFMINKYLLMLVVLAHGSIAFAFDDIDLCNNFNAEIRAGIAPTVWLNRGNFSAISCNATTILQLPSVYVPLFEMPHFNKLFGLPWFVGGHIGYMLGHDQELYAEINYQQAHKRVFTLNNLVIPNIDTIFFSLMPQNNYRVWSAFAGARKHWQPCSCQSLDLFLGGKIGLLHHQKVNFSFITYSLAVPAPYTSDSLLLFKKSTGFAGGLNIGFEFNCFCDLKIVATAEIVAACGPRANNNIPFDYATQSVVINPFLAPNSFIVGTVATELFFPITIGLGYGF